MSRAKKQTFTRKRILTPFWAVARCMPRRERFAKLQLQAIGVKVFLPYIKPSASPKLEPLFPGFLFVELEKQWSHVRYCPGIIDLYMMRGRPAKVRNSEMEALLAAHGPDGFIDLSLPPFRPQDGDLVYIRDGLFKRHIAIYKGRTSADRVKLLLSFLGSDQEIKLHKDDIGPL